MEKTILILGAGTGGIITAHELIKQLPKSAMDNFKIMIFEKEETCVFAPSLLWLMVGMRKHAQISRPLANLAKKNIQLIQGTIEQFDPVSKIVKANGQEYKGDYIVISMGAEYSTEYDLDKYGSNFFTLSGAEGFYSKLKEFRGGKIVVVIPSLPFKCPAAPYEATMLIESYLRKRGLRSETEISLYTPEPGPMSVAGKRLSDAVRQIVEAKGIKYFPEHQLISANEWSLTFNSGKIADYDLLAYTPKHQCPSVFRQSPIFGKSGWIEVNRNTMATAFADVFAIGDITSIPLELGKPLPKAGVFAHYQAEMVAHNIARKIAGKTPEKIFNGDGQCFLELGDGKAGYAGGNFYGSPLPVIKMKQPGYFWHWTKVWFEKYWFLKYF